MPEIELKHKRRLAIEKVADYFGGLPDTPFIPVPKEELPEKGSSLNDPNVAAWRGKIDCEGQWLEVIIALKSTFPDNLPRIYLTDPPQLIPHVTESRENHVCTFNRSEVFLNTAEPVFIVRDTLKAASRVIADGLQGRNTADFDREFRAYWIQETTENWLSLVSPGGMSRRALILHFQPALGKSSCLIRTHTI